MKICHVGLVRHEYDQWIKCGELFYNPSNGESWLNLSAMRPGLLQGKCFDGLSPPYIQGDLYAGDQWIGFINTEDAKTGAWYTVTVLLFPFVAPSNANLIRVKVVE